MNIFSLFRSRRRSRGVAHLILAGLTIMCACSIPADPSGSAIAPRAGDPMSVTLDSATGGIGISRRVAGSLLRGATVRVETAGGVRSSADADYDRSIETRDVTDAIGSGTQTTMTCSDKRKQLDIVVKATTYETPCAVVVEAVLRNVSRADLVVTGAEPVRALGEENGALLWEGVSKVLVNGKMYYDPGKVFGFPEGAEATGWWNACFYRGDRAEGLVVGYLGNPVALGEIHASRAASAKKSKDQKDKDAKDNEAKDAGAISLRTVSLYQKGFTLRPGAEVSTDRVMLLIAADPFTALESYADSIKRLYSIRLNPPANGWCSWFAYFGSISEAEVIRNAEFAARHLKGYGFDLIQIDDGFYRTFGDWEGNDRFPNGMKHVADRIRETGLTPGIWLAPYVVTEAAPLYREHPEWMLRHPDGRPQWVHPYLPEEHPDVQNAAVKSHGLDISNPGAAEWLRDLFNRAANEWGYDFIKIDFVDWTVLRAETFHDPTVTCAEMYRKGNEIMRAAMGPKKHLLDCGPGPVSVGTFDSMRIELDQPPVLWKQYYGNSASSGPAAAKRYYFHNRAWINDADHLVTMYLTVPQSQAAASIIGLSGGNVMSGDRLYDMDPVRLDIFTKILPAYGQAARPVDLFESDKPQVFALPIHKSFADWTVVGLFNADDENPTEKTVAVDRLGLDAGKTYLAYDFWKQKFFGEVTGSIHARLDPSSVALLSLHEKRGVPQVISTDRHVTQGAIELESVEWDAAAGVLRGVSLGPAGSDHRVYVYLPEPRSWDEAHRYFLREHEGYTTKMVEPNILRVHVRFGDKARTAWEVKPSDY